jgi:hypothetical protein
VYYGHSSEITNLNKIPHYHVGDAIGSFETSVNTHPTTLHHNLEIWSFQFTVINFRTGFRQELSTPLASWINAIYWKTQGMFLALSELRLYPLWIQSPSGMWDLRPGISLQSLPTPTSGGSMMEVTCLDERLVKSWHTLYKRQNIKYRIQVCVWFPGRKSKPTLWPSSSSSYFWRHSHTNTVACSGHRPVCWRLGDLPHFKALLCSSLACSMSNLSAISKIYFVSLRW